MQNFLVDAALEYRKKGWSVIPIKGRKYALGKTDGEKSKDSKKPLISWLEFQKRLPTENEIKDWFNKWSDANVAIITGSISNLAVIDLDSKAATDFAKNNNFKTTPTVKTGRDEGYHAYYKFKVGISNQVNINNLKLDIRGNGGYVIAPPSIHYSGQKYSWIKSRKHGDIPLADLPTIFNGGSNNKKTFAKIYKGTETGSRNCDLTRLVGKWFSLGMTFDEILAEALRVNERNDPCLSEKEVRSIVDSIYKANKIKIEQPEPWPDPIPLDSFSDLPEFPSEVLPSPGREMVEAISEINQVPLGLPASAYLGVLSTSLSKKVEIDLGTHIEPVNIYTCSTLESGERKTTTISTMTKPLFEYQKNKAEEMATEILEARNDYKIKEKRLETLQKKAARCDDENERRQLQFEASEIERWLDESSIPNPPIYLADDITAEAMGDVMADNNERLSIISAEGGIFGIMAGRYNEKYLNFDIFLKGHAGDPWSSHRIGRKAKSMESPALTMCLAVQRDVIKEIGDIKQFRGRGLLARFLYSLNFSNVGYRSRQNKSISKTLLKDYKKHIIELMDMPLATHTVKLDLEAQKLWDEFYNDVEIEMRPGKSLESIKDWGSKLPGAVARIAGLLHCAEHGREGLNKSISDVIVGASAAIGGFFKDHALAIFGLMKENPKLESAKRILEYIEAHNPDTFKGKDVLFNKNAFKTMEDVNPGLEILIERSYIRELPKKSTQNRGRPEATEYEVNPKIKNKPL